MLQRCMTNATYEIIVNDITSLDERDCIKLLLEIKEINKDILIIINY